MSTAFLWRVKPSTRHRGHGVKSRGCGFQAMFWAKKDSGASWYVDIGLEPGLGVSSGSYVKLAAEEKKKKISLAQACDRWLVPLFSFHRETWSKKILHGNITGKWYRKKLSGSSDSLFSVLSTGPHY